MPRVLPSHVTVSHDTRHGKRGRSCILARCRFLERNLEGRDFVSERKQEQL